MELNGWNLTYPQQIGSLFVSGEHEVIWVIDNQIACRLGVFKDRVIVFLAVRKTDINFATKKIELF